MILHRNNVTFFLDLPFNGGYEDVQLNPDVIHNMFGMNPGKQMSFGIANEGFGFTVIKIVCSTSSEFYLSIKKTMINIITRKTRFNL